MTTVSIPNHHQRVLRLRAAIAVLAVTVAAIVAVTLLGGHPAAGTPFERRLHSMTSCSELESNREDAWVSYQLTGGDAPKMRADAYQRRALDLGC